MSRMTREQWTTYTSALFLSGIPNNISAQDIRDYAHQIVTQGQPSYGVLYSETTTNVNVGTNPATLTIFNRNAEYPEQTDDLYLDDTDSQILIGDDARVKMTANLCFGINTGTTLYAAYYENSSGAFQKIGVGGQIYGQGQPEMDDACYARSNIAARQRYNG